MILVALHPSLTFYGARALQPGDRFAASDSDAHLLIMLKLAKEAGDGAPGDQGDQVEPVLRRAPRSRRVRKAV